MEPGDTPVADMIRGIRGLIVGGFSGGEPGANGEFSGVAKNSFYVENGEVKGAVMETMISGNLTDVFSNVTAVSKELVSDGTSAFPVWRRKASRSPETNRKRTSGHSLGSFSRGDHPPGVDAAESFRAKSIICLCF